MAAIEYQCEFCHAPVGGSDMQAFGDAFISHVREVHPDFPYPDQAVRNFAEATQRLSPVGDRVDAIESIEVHPVTADRMGDWLDFFDHDAFAGNPAWAACYCFEPHIRPPEESGQVPEELESWRANREAMVGLLGEGKAYGYLAYADGRPAGWVNASVRSAYTLYARGGAGSPADDEVIGISCFVIAPPYRRHGVAARLLDRVLADAKQRGAAFVEGYPFNEPDGSDMSGFRGPRSLYDENGFEPVEVRGRYTVVRRPV